MREILGADTSKVPSPRDGAIASERILLDNAAIRSIGVYVYRKVVRTDEFATLFGDNEISAVIRI